MYKRSSTSLLCKGFHSLNLLQMKNTMKNVEPMARRNFRRFLILDRKFNNDLIGITNNNNNHDWTIKRHFSTTVIMMNNNESHQDKIPSSSSNSSTVASTNNSEEKTGKENVNMKNTEQTSKPIGFTTRDFVKLFGVSVVGGTFGGMVGLGGNIILIPLITQLFPHLLSAKQIVATCLVTVVTAGFVGAGTLYFVGDNSVDIVTSIIIATFAAFTARFGVKISSSIQDRTLKLILAFFMLFVAPLVSILHSDDDDDEKNQEGTNKELSSTVAANKTTDDGQQQQPLKLPSIEEAGALFVLGSVIGVMSGLLGVGGGILIVPALSYLWSDKSPIKKEHASTKLVIGTSLAAMTIPSSVALYSHWRVGNVILKLAPILMGGSAIGAYSGGYLASSMDEQVLKHTFSLTMLVLGVRQFWKALKV